MVQCDRQISIKCDTAADVCSVCRTCISGEAFYFFLERDRRHLALA